jgi:pseudaminic acid cytidylyltransferase
MARLAIIPARGGSKRIPNKNIKNFLGKPIIAYSIEAAVLSDLFDEVMVSTDNREIADIALSYGAQVPFMRSDKNSDDYATTIDVVTEVINSYKDIGKEFEYTCCIYACAPFVTATKLIDAYSKLIKNSFDCIFPIVRYGFPIQRAVKINERNRIEMFEPKYMQTRSQDLQGSFHDVGQFYFFKTKTLLTEQRLWTDNTGFVELSEIECQDIDNRIDWQLAELKYKLIHSI